jgi:hypothetical protein
VTDISPIRHLSKRSRSLFRQIQADFELGPHHERLLLLFAEALDRCDAAQALINERGLTVTDRFGQEREAPWVRTKKDAEVVAARLLREIDLDAELPAETRPPHIQGRYP